MRRRRFVLALVLVVAATWVAAVAWQLLRIRDAAHEAREEIAALQAEATVESLLDGGARSRLRDVRADLQELHDLARSPVLAPLRIVPGVSRQLRSVDALSAAGVTGTGVGLDVAGQLEELLDGPMPSGQERLRMLDDVVEVAARARSRLAGISLGPDGPLVDELADARIDAQDGLRDLRQILGQAEDVAGSVRGLLAGGDHLVLAANNAEMRSGSGMFLQVGVLQADGGDFDVTDLTPTGTLMLPPGAVPAGSATYDEVWGFLQPTVEWRNLAASPRFEVTAELATRMWVGLGNPAPAGVIAVDPFALEAILRATGPIEVDGREFGSDDIVEFLLHDQYDDFRDDEPQDEVQAERRDRLGAIVGETLRQLDRGPIDVVELATGLRDAIGGRHLLAWSADLQMQEGWRSVGMAGALSQESIMVSLLNRGANKLDPFVEVEAGLDIEGRGEVLHAVLEVEITNDVGDGEVRYVAGPASAVDEVDEYGDYAGILALSLPGTASRARIDGVESLEVAHPDGPILALAEKFVLEQGERRRFTIRFDLPSDVDSILLEPSARPEPVSWRVGEEEFSDGRRHRVPIRG